MELLHGFQGSQVSDEIIRMRRNRVKQRVTAEHYRVLARVVIDEDRDAAGRVAREMAHADGILFKTVEMKPPVEGDGAIDAQREVGIFRAYPTDLVTVPDRDDTWAESDSCTANFAPDISTSLLPSR